MGVELHDVMLAANKSEVMFNLMLEVRNKLVEAWEKLGDGYRVEVRVVIWEGQDVVKVPTSTLFRKGDDWAVFVVESGRARLAPVEIGRRNGLEAQVLSGLEAGQEVVVHPGDTLEDGARIEPRAS